MIGATDVVEAMAQRRWRYAYGKRFWKYVATSPVEGYWIVERGQWYATFYQERGPVKGVYDMTACFTADADSVEEATRLAATKTGALFTLRRAGDPA